MQSTTGTAVRAGVSGLGHVGLYVRDLEGMRDWYRDTLDLKVADQSVERGICFLSADPETEHHELALARGRVVAEDTQAVQQVSWIVDSVERLRAFHNLFEEKGVKVQYEVTHGNALSIYFFDPEGNRNEVYFKTGVKAPQPFRKEMNFAKPAEEILAENKRLVAEGPAY